MFLAKGTELGKIRNLNVAGRVGKTEREKDRV